ncbi:MAG TPA: tRNA pseudouridine(38-40) synthase TruA [Candidatus Obscuribacterales bacterium]
MRIALLIEYDGRDFCGCQYQVGVRTVQADLESALAALARQPVTVIFSGRTDTGVHARGQVAHFDWPHDSIDLWRLCWSLNGILKPDVSVKDAQLVPDSFHARYSAVSRQYVYRILNRPQRSALLRHTHYFVPHRLALEAMSAAAGHLLGQHDFSAFKSSNSDRVSSVCRVSRAELLNLGEGELEFWVASDHFVYNMVRITVGTLIQIGLGKIRPEAVKEALAGKSRSLAGPTAPPWGLCLDSVTYPDAYDLFAGRTLSQTEEETGGRISS